MSDDQVDKDPEKPSPAAYEVGYGKPPKRHQFKKGQSGNPLGRPIREERSILTRQLRKDILVMLERERKVRTARGVRRAANIELLYEQLLHKALKEGHGPSLRFLIKEHQSAVRELNKVYHNHLGFPRMVEEEFFDEVVRRHGMGEDAAIKRRRHEHYIQNFRKSIRKRFLV